MEDLIKKIEQLVDLVKEVKAMGPSLPTIPAPSVPKPSMKPKATTIPGVKAQNKKDPKKVAEQIKNAQTQKLSMPVLKIESNGQWKL